MLWDFVYDKGFRHPDVMVGHEGWNPGRFGLVTTALLTVPTGEQFKKWNHENMVCIRARAFSGGSYWGYPAREDLGFGSLGSIINDRTMLRPHDVSA